MILDKLSLFVEGSALAPSLRAIFLIPLFPVYFSGLAAISPNF